jgi:protein-S-isoprenylcysteine O-methyltransferase Ste14
VNVLAGVSIVVCWLAFAAVWLITANYNATRAPAQVRRAGFGAVVGPVLVVAFLVRVVVPRADWQSVTFHAPWARFLGLAILLAGTALTLWARFVLGLMWSAMPAVKEGHQLRTSGPYAITRHPIYTGLLAMLLGSLLVAGAGPWIVPFPVALVLIEIKIRAEERLMTAQFPQEYPRYRQPLPQLVPGLRLVLGPRR